MPERILISRTDSIGDVLLTLPMAGVLKKHFPDSNVIFLGRNYTRDIVALSSYIDEFISWDDQEKLDKHAKSNWLKTVNADTIIHVFPKVEIDCTASYTDAGRVTYYRYELTNVMVTSYNVSGSGQAEDVPVEDFSLNFEEIKVTYTENDNAGKKKGNVEYSWKVEEGET